MEDFLGSIDTGLLAFRHEFEKHAVNSDNTLKFLRPYEVENMNLPEVYKRMLVERIINLQTPDSKSKMKESVRAEWTCKEPKRLKFATSDCTGVHLIIGRTQLSDVASFRALQTRICEIWIQCRQLHEKLKPHRKNCQISTNNKNFTVANVYPPFPPTICTYGGSEELQNLKLFF